MDYYESLTSSHFDYSNILASSERWAGYFKMSGGSKSRLVEYSQAGDEPG